MKDSKFYGTRYSWCILVVSALLHWHVGNGHDTCSYTLTNRNWASHVIIDSNGEQVTPTESESQLDGNPIQTRVVPVNSTVIVHCKELFYNWHRVSDLESKCVANDTWQPSLPLCPDLSDENASEEQDSHTKGEESTTSVTDSRIEEEPDNDAICQKNRKGGIGFRCKEETDCSISREKLESKGLYLVCAEEGFSKKICCPHKIDPVKAAQEKCAEYSKFRYVNQTRDGNIQGTAAVTDSALDCGRSTESLIAGDMEATDKEFPHMALVGYGNSETEIEWSCSGSLISDQFILSAAYCNNNPRTAPTWALLGKVHKPGQNEELGEGYLHRIVERINHPHYKPPKQENDIALFKLERPVLLKPSIRPVCLARPPNVTPTSNEFIATRWGQTDAGSSKSDSRLKVTLNQMEDSACESKFKDGRAFQTGYNATIMMCAGQRKGRKDICKGDSGGPLQTRINNTNWKCMWVQEGITSLGSPYCGGGTPAVYTRVSSFLHWILPIVWPAEDLKTG